MESHVRAWFEFIWLRVETGGQRLGLMKAHCIKTWWNLNGSFRLGGGGGACRYVCLWRPMCSILYPLTHWSCGLGAFAEDC
jgi:hypothetical protein